MPGPSEHEQRLARALGGADRGEQLQAMAAVYERFYESGGRTVDEAARLFAPGFELCHRDIDALDGVVYRGTEGFERWRREMADLFEYDRFVPEGVITEPGAVVVLGHLIAKGRRGGVELRQPEAHLFQLGRDGLVERLTVFFDPDEALRAAGIAPRGGGS